MGSRLSQRWPALGSLRVRIVGSFVTALLVMLFAQFTLIYHHAPLRAPLRLVVETYLPLTKQVTRLVQDQERIGRDLQRMVDRQPSLAPDVLGMLDIYSREIRDDLDVAALIVSSASPSSAATADAAVLARTQGSLDRVRTLWESLRADMLTLANGQLAPADQQAVHRRLRSTHQQLGAELDRLARTLDARVTSLTATTEQRQARATETAIIATLVAAAVALILLLTSLAALRPIGQLTSEVQRLAAGQMGGPVEVRGENEIGMLAREFNAMAEAIKARDKRLAAQARSERLALIGQMLAQITHEVRNPLNAMSLNAELLADELDGLDPEHQTEAWETLAMVRREIARLTDVTAHYLQLARRPAVQRETCDMADVVDEIARLLQPELDAIDAALEVEAERPCLALLDASQLRQALHNIVHNALEAGARRLSLRLVHQDADIILTLDDDGPGMDEEARQRATDPFFSTKAQGTGLGLAIVRQILEDHGGRVEIGLSPLGGTSLRLVWVEAWGEPDRAHGEGDWA